MKDFEMSNAEILATQLDKEQIDTVRRDVMNHEAAALLRQQDALLRQALDALNSGKGEDRWTAADAIQEHLNG